MTLADRRAAEVEAIRARACLQRLIRDEGTPDRYTFPAPGELLIDQIRALHAVVVPRGPAHPPGRQDRRCYESKSQL